MVNLKATWKQPPVPNGWVPNQPVCFGEVNKLMHMPGFEPWIAHIDPVIIQMVSF
jgi:hypothetical protein